MRSLSDITKKGNSFTPAARVWLHSSASSGTHETPPSPADRDLPICQSSGEESRRWGQGLTATKMKECRWLRPALVGQFEFVEWTADLHLRHTASSRCAMTRRLSTCGASPS